MLKIMPESAGNILGFRASGTIGLQDFRQKLAPRLKAAIVDTGKARVLLCLGDDFDGIDLEAIKNEARASHLMDDLEKIALVGGSFWVTLQIRLGASFLAGEVETFSSDELEEAWEWIRAWIIPGRRNGAVVFNAVERLAPISKPLLSVTLSAAKGLKYLKDEILRFAQNDRFREYGVLNSLQANKKVVGAWIAAALKSLKVKNWGGAMDPA